MTSSRIEVVGERPYQVVVGSGIAGELPRMIGERAVTVVVIHAAGLERLAEPVCSVLREAGYDVRAETVPAGEAAKDISVAARLWERLGEHRVGRADAIVGVGGGAVTDLAGFVAATWLRGVPVVLVPTTLLAIVDAAVGGKTAVNTGAGKNLVGAFHSPAGVLADLSALATLPGRDYVSGLAEVIKVGFIADPVILDLIEADPSAAAAAGGPAEAELVRRAIAVKAEVVSQDPREAGRREILNYGHTLGHAIELAEQYRVPHGEGVSAGMMFAASLARLAGRLDEPTARRHRDVLASVGLPVSYRSAAGGRSAGWAGLRDIMAVDKKVRGQRLRFVVLDGLAKPGILADPPEELLELAFSEVSG